MEVTKDFSVKKEARSGEKVESRNMSAKHPMSSSGRRCSSLFPLPPSLRQSRQNRPSQVSAVSFSTHRSPVPWPRGTSTALPLQVEVCQQLKLHHRGPTGGRMLLTSQPLTLAMRLQATLQPSCVLTCEALPLLSTTHFTSPSTLGGRGQRSS